MLEAGSRIVCHHTIYVWTKEILNTYLSKFGVEVVYVDMTDLDQLREAVKTKTKVVYFEPFANPTLDVIDVKSAIEIGKASGGIVVMATPLPELLSVKRKKWDIRWIIYETLMVEF